MCWHKGFLSVWPLQSYLSPPPCFHSFGPLQKITTITVTVIQLCVFCVLLCRLHKWFIFVLAWARLSPHLGSPPTALLYLCSISRRHVCLTANEAALMLLCDWRAAWVVGRLLNVSKTSLFKATFCRNWPSEMQCEVAVILPSHWSHVVQKQVTAGRDTIHPTKRHCAIHVNLKLLF